MSILTVHGLSMRFGGLTAVNNVSFSVPAGSIFSVIGPNGAGKTTVFNAITGIYSPTEGHILFEGSRLTAPFTLKKLLLFGSVGAVSASLIGIGFNAQSLWDAMITSRYIYQAPFSWVESLSAGREFLGSLSAGQFVIPSVIAGGFGALASWALWNQARRTPEVITRGGIARTFQNIRLFRSMTVLENLLLGMDTKLSSSLLDGLLHLPRERIEFENASQKGMELLRFVGLAEDAHDLAGSLPYGHQRRLEIARALASEPKLLLLDEPAAGMNPTESSELMELIFRIRDRGITVLLIEHHMKVVMGISDRIVVLDYGNKIAEGTPEEVRRDPQVVKAYLGAEASSHG